VNVITFVCPLPVLPEYMQDALEGIVLVNMRYLRDMARLGTPIPDLYQAGVHYQAERIECFAPIYVVQQRGWGDCDDLSAWLTAELRLKGLNAMPYVRPSKSGVKGHYHALVKVETSDRGWVEVDPCVKLGMKGRPTE